MRTNRAGIFKKSMGARQCRNRVIVPARRNRVIVPSKATITNKSRPAGSFSSSQSGGGRLAGSVFYLYVFSLRMWVHRERILTPFCPVNPHSHPPDLVLIVHEGVGRTYLQCISNLCNIQRQSVCVSDRKGQAEFLTARYRVIVTGTASDRKKERKNIYLSSTGHIRLQDYSTYIMTRLRCATHSRLLLQMIVNTQIHCNGNSVKIFLFWEQCIVLF